MYKQITGESPALWTRFQEHLWLWWADDHDIAHLQAKTVPINLIWSESAQWLLSCGIRKIPGVLNTPMGMPKRPQWANDHDVAHLQANVVPMNLIWSESAHRLLSSGVHKVPRALIMPAGMPMWPQWANDHDVSHLQAKMIPMNLIWSEFAQWLLSYSICKVCTR